jgi:hypothetical protein
VVGTAVVVDVVDVDVDVVGTAVVVVEVVGGGFVVVGASDVAGGGSLDGGPPDTVAPTVIVDATTTAPARTLAHRMPNSLRRGSRANMAVSSQ